MTKNAASYVFRSDQHRHMAYGIRQGIMGAVHPGRHGLFAGVTGICPGLIFWKKCGFK